MVEIIPTILTGNPIEAKEMVTELEEFCDRIQIDIIDGTFADNKTIDPSALSDVDSTLKFDFHLMTKEPIDWVERAVRAGADRVIGHIEQMQNQRDFVGKVQETGVSVGLAIDLGTPVSQIEPEILTSLDVVLVLSVKAGWGGQEFDPSVLKKIEKLAQLKLKDITPFKICVDGGVTEENIKKIVASGADEVAVGRRLFEGNIGENINKLRSLA